MTIKYECNKCGKIMDYEADKTILLRVPDNEALAHICPDCQQLMLDFANGLIEHQYRLRDKKGRFKK